MNSIITIGRQFGSGGREIGKRLAEHYGVPFYDKDLITRAAQESGFAKELIESQDERPTNSFLYNLVMDTYSFGYNAAGLVDMPISQKVFLAQFNTIKRIADEGPCVLVGRCADYALEDRNNHISIFISGNMECRIKRVMERFEIPEGKAQDMIVRKDKQRQSYYNYYASSRWGMCKTYDLSINSSVLGIDKTVDLIAAFVDAKEAGSSQ